MQPLDLICAALREAPDDADRLLCWLINSAPPAKRQSLHQSLSTALQSASLAGVLKQSMAAPQLFTPEAADLVWKDLTEELAGDRANEDLEAFFRPSDVHFVPQAYPDRWAPAEWDFPLTPAAVREALGMRPAQTERLTAIAAELVRLGTLSFAPKTPELETLKRAKLRVGVLPYGDCLPLATLLYAVSDRVSGIEFGPASFYSQVDGSKSISIESGFFNVGYATKFQLKKLRASCRLKISEHEVFDRGFTRSLLMRTAAPERDVLPLKSLSFVGQFAPDSTCKMDPNLSDPAVLKDQGILFLRGFPISERIDPIINWEIPLILAFASGTDGLPKCDGLALTISTDAHLWAASFGLNLEADLRQESSGRSFVPSFRRAAWDPADQLTTSPEDLESELNWFIPAGDTQHAVRELTTLTKLLVFRHIEDGLEILKDEEPNEATRHARKRVEPVARALLAPLLTAFPDYQGAMLFAPPEAWLAKLAGPETYISYRPPWHHRLSGGPTGGGSEVGPLADFIEQVAIASR